MMPEDNDLSRKIVPMSGISITFDRFKMVYNRPIFLFLGFLARILNGIGAGLLIINPPFMEEKALLMKEKLEGDTWEILIIL